LLAEADIAADARAAADALGIPHYVLDYEERFRKAVIDAFADAYVAGLRPVPCVRCNQTVKFRDLIKVARDLGAPSRAQRDIRRLPAPTCDETSMVQRVAIVSGPGDQFFRMWLDRNNPHNIEAASSA